MKNGVMSRASVLAFLLALPAVAWAGPGSPASVVSPFASAVTPTFRGVAADSPRAVSGGFSVLHLLGDVYPGFYGNYAQRVTEGNHPVSIDGQVAWHSRFGQRSLTAMGGAQVAVIRRDAFSVSGRGLAGITDFFGESTDFTMQFTGVFNYHLKQNGLSIEAEGGLFIDRAVDGDLFSGFIFNIGVMKRFGGPSK